MFRPCIDLHNGKVKQIIGGTLDDDHKSVVTNFTSEKPASWFAELYKNDALKGGHIIRLGEGNEQASLSALAAYPNGMQIGGGITNKNASKYLSAGATHVIMTSFVFNDGRLNEKNLDLVLKEIGKENLVLDLSCRVKNGKYWIVTDRWQKFTSLELNGKVLNQLAEYCDEFLVHAVDVEGLCQGIDWQLVELLYHAKVPTTYAGGASSLDDLIKITEESANKIDLTIGSALDIFGGSKITYKEVLKYNRSLK